MKKRRGEVEGGGKGGGWRGMEGGGGEGVRRKEVMGGGIEMGCGKRNDGRAMRE